MSFTGWHSSTPIKILMAFALLAFLGTACSVRPYRMKRAKQLYQQGQGYLSQGDRDKATAKFEASLEISRMIEFKPGIAHNLNEIAIIRTTRGEFAQAREILTESLAIYRELKMTPEVSKTLNNIVITYTKEGQFKKALAKYEELIDWDGETGNRLGQAVTLNNMAMIYQNHLRDRGKAREKYMEALQIFRELGKTDYAKAVQKGLATLEQ